MKSESKLCLIVDAYSTGRFLPSELKKYGFDCIHVQSTPKIPKNFQASFNLNDFIENIIHENDIEETLKRLSKYSIACLIVGSEFGVEFGDILSEKMKLPSNGTEFSKARRDKFEMAETLREAGLSAVNHIKSANLEKILSWVKVRGEWPVVLKPINSAGTDNVIFCKSEDDVVLAFQRIIESKNLAGQQNSEVLAQEFLSGTEYVVNTVSLEGQHYVNEIWEYRKRRVQGSSCIYDLEKALPFDGNIQAELRDYITQVLNALRIKWGAGHSEVMMTKAGAVLVETGARLAGAIVPAAVSKAMGCNQVELVVKSYIEPENFKKIIDTPYSLYKNIFKVWLISEVEGKIKSLSQIDKIKELQSFFDMYLSLKVGKQLRKTIDLHSSPGYVYLVHENLEILEQDYCTIRDLEKNLYDVE